MIEERLAARGFAQRERYAVSGWRIGTGTAPHYMLALENQAWSRVLLLVRSCKVSIQTQTAIGTASIIAMRFGRTIGGGADKGKIVRLDLEEGSEIPAGGGAGSVVWLPNASHGGVNTAVTAVATSAPFGAVMEPSVPLTAVGSVQQGPLELIREGLIVPPGLALIPTMEIALRANDSALVSLEWETWSTLQEGPAHR